jgi:MYXO-CTERM domain-containing protein
MTRALLCALVVIAPSGGLANPVAVELARLQQVPKTTNVQVTYAVASGMQPEVPTGITRDGQLLGGTWLNGGTYNANGGSGVSGYVALQLCDCSVPVGTHNYLIVSGSAYGGSTLQGTITVVADLQDYPDAGSTPPDAMPWEIPDPTGPQGIDCKTVCSGGGQVDGGTPAGDGGTTDRDAAAGQRDAGTAAHTDRGCSQAATGSTGPFVLVALVGLLALVVLRRSR